MSETAPQVLENLSEEEAYLFAILSDPAGLDQAEFLWYNPSAEDNKACKDCGSERDGVHRYEHPLAEVDAEQWIDKRPGPSGCFRAWAYQHAWWRSSDSLQIDQCARALATDTRIPTPTGWTTMGDLRPGDVVYDEAGVPTVVTAVSPIWTDRSCYEMCFDDHTSIIADGDHLWLTWNKAARRARNPNRRGVPQPRVRTTNEIRATLNCRSERNHAIEVAEALQAQEAVLPLDPYYLGYWLGDGNSGTSEVTTADRWVVDELERRGFGIVNRAAPIHYGVTWPYEHNRKTKSVQAVLRNLGVLHNKHIPSLYLRASERQRRELLAGIVDSDGHLQKNGSCEVIQKNQRLAEDIMELLRSLGEKPRVTKRTAWMNGIDCGPVYRVTWRPRSNPAALPRKRAAFVEPGRVVALGERRIVDVRPVATRPVRCITVASASHLFLAGDGMVPTHNSVGKSLSIKVRGCAFPFLFAGQEMVITAPELVHLEPIVSLIEGQVYSTRVLKEMIPRGKSAVTHRPFQMNFVNGARIIGRIPQRDGKGVKGCSVADTLILTREGYRRADELKTGDLVLTHEGRYRPITQIVEDVNDCYEVRGQSSFPITVSCDHRFLGAENSATPKQKRSFYPLAWHDVEFLVEHQVYWATPTTFPELPIPPIGDSVVGFDDWPLWWLVGRYLADGYTDSKRVIWCAPDQKMRRLTERLDHLHMHHYQIDRDHSSASLCVHCSVDFAAWLRTQFGGTASTKRIPAWVLGMPESDRMDLLGGYLAGDGWHNRERNRWEAGTASKELALGLQMLAQSLGRTVNCSVVQPTTTEIAGVALKSEPLPSWRLQIGDGHPAPIDNYLVGKVKSVTPVGKQTVYNIVVEEDHSYLTGSIMSHNIHPIWLELDEAQDYPHAGWVELRETLKRGFTGATWRAHGVTRGVRDDFFESTQDTPDNPWRVHRFAAMWRPNWSDEERREALEKYGSREDPDYRRNILGLHGDKTNPIFVLTQLMRNVDSDPASEYNLSEYFKCLIKVEQLELFGHTIAEVLDFPPGHLSYAGVNEQERLTSPKAIYWAGMDIGFTIDPSEILIFVEYREKPRDAHTKIRLLTRISMSRMPHREQLWAILHTIDFYKPKVFSMDKGGLGLPLFQELQEQLDAFTSRDWDRVSPWMRMYDLEAALTAIKGYNFSEKLVVDFDKSIEVTQFEDPVSKAGMRRNAKEYATDVLREMVDRSQLWLPWDDDLLKQFQGGTWTSARSMDAYGRRIFSKGNDHTLDAARMMALGWAQYSIEEMLKNQPAEPVYDTFVTI